MVYTLVGLLLDVVMMEAEYAKLGCESVLQYSNTPVGSVVCGQRQKSGEICFASPPTRT